MQQKKDKDGFSVYDNHCDEAAFLLGGIGAGNFSIGARGQLKDWEIFGQAGKGNYMPNTFFAIYAKGSGENPFVRVLEARLNPPFAKARGFVDYEIAGVPRFESSTAYSRYPFFNVQLDEPRAPVSVTMESFTPFIPLDEQASGLPAAVLRYKVKNLTNSALSVSVAGSLGNLSCLKQYDNHTWLNYQTADEAVNTYVEKDEVKGLHYTPKKIKDDNLYYGSMALTTTAKSTSYKRAWLSGGWWDGLQDFWDDFSSDGRLESESVYTQKDVAWLSSPYAGSLAVHEEIPAGEERIFEFQISWYFPNRVNCWNKHMYNNCVRSNEQTQSEEAKLACDCAKGTGGVSVAQDEYPIIKKHYATRFSSAFEVASYLYANINSLEKHSRDFANAFYSSTIPACVIESVANTITVIRSNTCFWLCDGRFAAWEGCFDDDGCCEGTCTHVWNYAQTIAFMFPRLEQAMRRQEYMVETNPDGKMNFRTYQLFGMPGHDHVPAADGQLGTLVRLFREWRISGDDAFLKEMWPNAKLTLDFAFKYWDKDGDGVLDTNQFNTYDIAFEGPSSMVNSLFFAALKAGAEIAAYLGDNDSAKLYTAAFEKGSKNMDELLWGGEYYIQKVNDVNEYRYQYGEGCLSDQIFGQTLAHVAGLGYVLPKEHVESAIRAVHKYNYKRDFTQHVNLQRTYVLNGESGLLLCTWPRGERPRLPFPYSDEVWTGIEYQVATCLIYEGAIDEAMEIVQGIRNRHDGIARSPWNEVECGHHYARSLACYGVYNALCGYTYDLPHKKIGFAPRISADSFKCFFICASGWGVFSRYKDADGTIKTKVETLYGDMLQITVQDNTNED